MRKTDLKTSARVEGRRRKSKEPTGRGSMRILEHTLGGREITIKKSEAFALTQHLDNVSRGSSEFFEEISMPQRGGETPYSSSRRCKKNA